MADPIADSFRNVTSIAPSVTSSNPGLVAAMAQANMQSPDVEAVSAFSRGQQIAKWLQAQQPDVQRKYVSGMPQADRTLVFQTGYQLPTEPHRGILGSIGHAFGTVLGKVAEAANWPLDQIKRDWRFLAAVNNASDPTAGGSFTAIFDPNVWRSAWRDTEDGQRSYNQQALRSVRDAYSPEVFNLAKQLADGDTFDTIAGYNIQKRAQLEQIANKPEFKSALQELQDAHLSPGRELARSLNIPDDSKAFTFVSGAGDGAFDWFADPLLGLGKAAKFYQITKWGIRGLDSEGIRTLLNNPTVERGWADITSDLNKVRDGDSQAYDRLVTRHPDVQRLVEPMLRFGVHDVETAKDFLASQQGLMRIVNALPDTEAVLVPGRLSAFGEKAIMPLREGKGKVIDFLQNGYKFLPSYGLVDTGGKAAKLPLSQALLPGNVQPLNRIRNMAKRMVTRVPEEHVFDATSPNATTTFRKIALTFLPKKRVDELTTAYVNADLAGKRTIYRGMLAQVGEASGITQSTAGMKYWSKFLDDLNGWANDRTYGVAANTGKRLTDAGQRDLGYAPSQMTEVWGLPNFAEMQAHAARVGVLDRIFGGLNESFVNRGMQQGWKGMVLARPGFALRAGLDEMLNGLVRGQGLGWLKGRLALSSQADWKLDPFRPLANVMVKALPDGAASKVMTGYDWMVEHTLGRIGEVVRGAQETLATPEYVAAVKDYLDHQWHREAVGEEVSYARELHPVGQDLADLQKADLDAKQVRWVPNDQWDVQTAQGQAGALRWAHNLETLLDDRWRAGHIAIDTLHEQPADAVEKIYQYLKSPEADSIRRNAEIAQWTRDGRRVVDAATEESALRAWAEDIRNEALALTHTAEGKPIKDVIDHIKTHGQAPSARQLNDLPIGMRPEHTVGPEYTAIGGKGQLQKLFEGWWNLVVDKPMKWMSRQPWYIHNYAQARMDLAGVERELAAQIGPENAKNLIEMKALERAREHTIRYVHNPKQRTQFSVIARNFFPFRHAQEGFLTRWTNALRLNPEGFRRAQLIFEGVQHSGLTVQGSDGETYFVYPGTGTLFSHLIWLTGKVFPGLDLPMMPKMNDLQAKLRFMSPALQEASGEMGPASLVLPTGGGPMGALSMRALKILLPETNTSAKVQEHLAKAVQGDIGAGQPLWESFVPSVVSRFYKVWQGDEGADSQVASASKQAVAYLIATGHAPKEYITLPDGSQVPNPRFTEESEIFKDRWKSWTRAFLTLRTIFGLAAPSAPQNPDFSPPSDPAYMVQGIKTLNAEWQHMLRRMPYEDALAQFMEKHPDGTPFITSGSETSAGWLPSTDEAYKWMQDHADFLKAYPKAAPYLIPSDPGKFSFDAHNEQLALKIRQNKTLDQFYKDVSIQAAEAPYFKYRDIKDAAVAQAKATGDTATEQAITRGWAVWSKNYLALHPFFNEYMADGGSRDQERKAAVTQLMDMLSDPRVPHTVQTEKVALMVRAYNTWSQVNDALHGFTDQRSNNMRDLYSQRFTQWMEAFVQQNPDMENLYNHVFRFISAA